MKYILVTGGVVSGLGKGVTASSIGLLLKACGLRVTSIKIDPYLNTDAGTMSPCEHGEVFVLDDGGEVDLDLGNYERFLDIKLTCDNNITAGKIYQSVIDKERRGDYLGRTVQVVPHITDAIQEWIERVAVIPVDGKDGPPDVCVIELGGTIGDIESMPFMEALGQFSYRVGAGNFCLVHVSLVPVLEVVGEQKTKPTQHSVRRLRGLGLSPNILACRSATALEQNVKEKLSQFCHVLAANIITLYDVSNIWHIPLLLKDQKAHEAILKQLNLLGVSKEPILEEWTSRAQLCDMLHDPVRIAIVGKYTSLPDAYLSVSKALLHASIACCKKLIVDWVSATDLEATTAKEAPDVHRSAWNLLKGADGVLVPGGFGHRGVEGKILAAKYARENGIPFFGICLGMQIAVIEFTRSVLGLQDANSTEFNLDTKNPCVIFMPEGSKTHMGGTMRLGSRRTYFQVHNCRSAKLLAYLHEAIEPKVVHRDIKSSNILIDTEFNSKVSDFGLAKLLGSEKSHITTRVMGTFGYVAPEYANTGLLNEKSDAYSFGVLMLEAVTGRDPVDYGRPANEVNLVEWLKVMVGNRKAEEVVDPNLEVKPTSRALKRALLIALRCVDPESDKRPKMSQVARMLEADEFPLRESI